MGLQLQIDGKPRDLGGGFIVQRLLPSVSQRAVGPFVFFDHFGPVTVQPDDAFDVRPHPHIGLATVTYLLEGAVMHRDSLGSVQEITPGAINWMTAGRGIVHSERRPDRLAGKSYRNHGFQLWAALPEALETAAPAFAHTPADAIPQVDAGGNRCRVLVGEAFGVTSPVATSSPTLLLDLMLAPDRPLSLPPLAQELAVYPVDGDLHVDDMPLASRRLGVLQPGQDAVLRAPGGARVLVLGGSPLGRRFMWWNFVASDRQLIRQAAADWQAGYMAPVPGDDERIELPATPLPD